MPLTQENLQGVDTKHLYKIWIIDLDDAKITLDVTNHISVWYKDPKLNWNYGINDCMLRYKNIQEYFFRDKYFSTKKAGKS